MIFKQYFFVALNMDTIGTLQSLTFLTLMSFTCKVTSIMYWLRVKFQSLNPYNEK